MTGRGPVKGRACPGYLLSWMPYSACWAGLISRACPGDRRRCRGKRASQTQDGSLRGSAGNGAAYQRIVRCCI